MEIIQQQKVDLARSLFGNVGDPEVQDAARKILLAALDPNTRIELSY